MTTKKKTSKRTPATPRDKAGKFVELGTKRVAKAIKAIRAIGNLSNRNSYEYTEEQVKRIEDALQRELNSVMARFAPKDKAASSETLFTFDDDENAE